MPVLDRDRLFPIDKPTRALARDLFETVADLPIISPIGHTDPQWFAQNTAFPDPAQLFITPDHYIFRMLFSHGIPLEDLGITRKDGAPVETDSRKIWRRFATHYTLFRATPSQLWMDHALAEVFGVTDPLNADTADAIYDHLATCLRDPAYHPRACLIGSRLQHWPPPMQPLTRWNTIKQSRRPTGLAVLSQPIARML